MNNVKTYKMLYYLCFITFLIITFFSFVTGMASLGVFVGTLNFGLFIMNMVLFIVFCFFSWKKWKLKKINILFPILFLIFSLIVMVITILYNSIVILPFMHFNYYFSFIFIGYVLLNGYTLLSFNKK